MKSQNCLVVIQARFNSSRLPGKILFPINGVPLVVLAAQRASNTGKKVVVATSTLETDDEVCLCLERYGIPYVRGDLDNTLSRFNTATLSLSEDDLVFRLTADNIFPDGKMLDEMEEQYFSSGASLMACSSMESNVPYGVSAELMRVKHIREAFKNAETDYEREHVTPYIRNKYEVSYFASNTIFGLSSFRCTIDTFDDYMSVKRAVSGIVDLVNSTVPYLISKLPNMIFRPLYEPAVKPMTLGGAQFGLDYGISNKSGKPSQKEINEIIKHAITNGVQYIDTASAYGDSEVSIGDAIKGGWRERVQIITKTLPFSNLESCNNNDIWSISIRNSVLKSCLNLGVNYIDVVMLHRASHIEVACGSALKELEALKSEGVINAIGVSVQSPEELEMALNYSSISFIQMPFNILDNRWASVISKIKNEKKKRDLQVHVRSSLLQGLLQSNESSLWEKAFEQNHERIVNWLENWTSELEKISVSDLCISYVNSQSWVDSVVIGVDSKSQLFRNLQSISMPLLSFNLLESLDNSKPKVSYKTLNPAMWRK